MWESRPLTKTTKENAVVLYSFKSSLYIYILYNIFSITMEKTVFRRQKQMKAASEHCSVPLCSVSSRYNSCASFYSFPVKEEIRKKCIVNIRRINFQITKHTKVCSVHFKPDDFVEGTSRRRLKKGAVPSLFEWNRERQMQPPRLSIWERQERPPLPESDMEENEMEIDRGHAVGHDYCSVPEPAALDLSLSLYDPIITVSFLSVY